MNCTLVRVPGSKSYTNRALVMAALTQGTVVLRDPLYSEDTEAMIECLRVLGLTIDLDADRISVCGDVRSIEDRESRLYACDSGTTARFLLALACVVPGVQIIEGSERLSQRPIRDLVDALRNLGARIEYCKEEGQLPVRVGSSSLLGEAVRLRGDLSSQFCSALLMIAPFLKNGLIIEVEGRQISKPYVEMTLGCLREWGVGAIQSGSNRICIPKNQIYRKTEYRIEGDYSSAGYFFAIAALTKSTIEVENLHPMSLQADRRFLDILQEMGNRVIFKNSGVIVEGRGVQPVDVDMESCPDQAMTLAVLAAFASGTTTISGIGSLRNKETERIEALKIELGKMGIQTKDTSDTLTIYGGSPQAADIDTYGDHRIAMAFAVAKMQLPEMVIHRPEVVNKTFPRFWEELQKLR